MTTSLLLSDEVLSTTRAVRRRLDFDRPVDPDLVRECVARALQAPSGGNLPMMRFVVVMDKDLRSRVGALYREAYEEYKRSPTYIGRIDRGDPALNERQQRSARSADFLGEPLGDAPAIVIGCHLGRLPDGSRTAEVVS